MTTNDKLLELAREAGKSAKSEADFAELRQQLMKATIEAALNAELDDRLDATEATEPNSRHGYTGKTIANRRWRVRAKDPSLSSGRL